MEPCRDLNMHPGFRRVPYLPRSREREKRLAGGRAKMPMSKKPYFILVQSKILWQDDTMVIFKGKPYRKPMATTASTTRCIHSPRYSVGNAREVQRMGISNIVAAWY